MDQQVVSQDSAVAAEHDRASTQTTFESQVQGVLQRLRVSLAQLIGAIPGESARPTDLERTLGLGTKLAWQVHRIAYSTNPLAESEHVPGAAGIRQVLRAGRKANVPPEFLHAVEDAMEAFERVVRLHAGDRLTFITMVSGLLEDDELIDLKLRRALFRENSRVWGVQAKTSLCASIYAPGNSEALVDSALVRGMHEINRLRTTAPLRLSGARLRADHLGGLDQCPLEGEGASLTQNTSILQEFSTKPLPKLISCRKGDHIETYLPPGRIGKLDAPTYFLASARRGIPWQDGEDPVMQITSTVAVTKPCERFLMDIFLHEDLMPSPGAEAASEAPTPPMQVQASVYGSLSDLGQPVQFSELGEGEHLPVEIERVAQGRAIDAVHTPHVPRYAAMFEHVCNRMKWDANRFVLLRWEFRYPILGAVLFSECRIPRQKC